MARIKDMEGVSRKDLLYIDNPGMIQIVPGFNARKKIGDLSSLEASIEEDGVFSPILCRPDRGNEESPLILIAGERRLRACMNIKERGGEVKIPIIIHECDEQKAYDLMAIENLERKDLNPIEEADVVNKMVGWGFSDKEVAGKLHMSIAWVQQRRTLGSAAREVKQALANDKISFQAALNLATKLPYDKQAAAVERALMGKPDKGGDKGAKADASRRLRQEAGANIKPGKKQIGKFMDYVSSLEVTPGAAVSAEDGIRLMIGSLNYTLGVISETELKHLIIESGAVTLEAGNPDEE